MEITKESKPKLQKVKSFIPSSVLRVFKSASREKAQKHIRQISKKLIQEVPNGISLVGHTFLTFYGEHMQDLASKGIVKYTPIMGYLSDYASIVAFASANIFIYNLLGITEPEKKYTNPVLLGAVWSGQEIMCKFIPNTTEVFDPEDIAVYWIGVGIACGIDYFSNKIRIFSKNFEDVKKE